MTMAKRRVAPAKTAPEPEPVVEYDLPDDFGGDGVVSGLDLLKDLEDGPTPAASDVGARGGPRREVPDGDYVGALQIIRVSKPFEEIQASAYMKAYGQIKDGGVKDSYVGAGLPWLNIPLTPKLNDRGNRRDFQLWSLADAVLGADRRKEIQESSTSYRSVVGAIITELQETISDPDDLVCLGVTVTSVKSKTSDRMFHNLRIYPLPDGIEPILPIEDVE